MSWWRLRSKRRIAYGACSDIGLIRNENEDAYGRFPAHATPETEEQLFVVADGMGGHVRGREASRAAVEVASRTYFSARGRPVSERLRRAFEAANRSIHQRSFVDGQQEEMGTTCTALAFTDGQVHLAHVGDSRAYRINHHGVEQLTQDHTLVEEMRREGILTDAEARAHPNRNTLVRAVGTDPMLKIDVWHAGPVEHGDCYLLCTDGLAEVTEGELQHIVLFNAPQRACEKLVATANERGGYDNVTAMIVRIE